MKIRFFLLLLATFALQSCSKPEKKVYHIGIDESFFPLNLNSQAINVFAFSNELIQEISKLKKTELMSVNFSWDNLVESLYLKKTEGIISSAPPNLINNTKFSFSNLLLKTGPVLIVPLQETKLSLSDFSGSRVAMGKTNEELDLMKLYPDIEFVFYESIIEALEGVADGKYAASLIPILQAHAYLLDLFQNSLMISSNVLTNTGLRLLTLKNEDTTLSKIFNEAILELQENGTYDALIQKWSLFQ
jgi:polar amino acid transport system substrate-binding protein